mgnify:CR=1 FL=1
MSTESKPRGLGRRLVGAFCAVVAALVAVVLASAGWVAYATAGKVYDVDDAPDASVAIVLGAQVRDGKPMRFLAGRLDTAIALMAAGKIKGEYRLRRRTCAGRSRGCRKRCRIL